MSVKRYNGSTWDTYAGATNLSATQSQWKKTAVGGETTLTGSDDSLITLAYTVGQEAVYVNGVLMVRGADYTATDGSSVVLTSPLVANNVVQVISAVAYAVANVIPGTTITTKGDLVTGSAIGTPTRLPIGTNNSFLVADSTQATGIRWSTNGGTFTTWRKAAAGGETTLSGTDDFALTLAYTAGQEMVYINGVLLERGVDYTASNGTSVTGLTALVAGDIATVITIGTFAIPNAIQSSTVTAKGDLIVANGASTVTNLPVGSDGTTLVANSSASTGVSWATPVGSLANPVINGGFDIWQRGTTNAFGTVGGYGADRYIIQRGSWASGATMSRQATGDTINLPNIQYCARIQRNSGDTSTQGINIQHSIETANAIPFAGKTVTFSFYARAGASFATTNGNNTLFAGLYTGTGTDQNLATAGFTGIVTAINSSSTLTTTWQRFAYTATLGTNVTEIGIAFAFNNVTGTAGANDYFDVTGVQIDLGSYNANTAPAFRRSGGTLQGELAACQRYYVRWGGTVVYEMIGQGFASSTGQGRFVINYPVTMRTAPSTLDFSTIAVFDGTTVTSFTSAVINSGQTGNKVAYIEGQASLIVANRPYVLFVNNTTSGYLGLSAEL